MRGHIIFYTELIEIICPYLDLLLESLVALFLFCLPCLCVENAFCCSFDCLCCDILEPGLDEKYYCMFKCKLN